MDSEPTLGRQYADLTMRLRPDMRRYQLLYFLIKFKYIKLNKLGISAEQLKQLSDEELKAKTILKEKLAESEKQLKTYRQTLQSCYGNQLRLHSYSVVAIGYERIIHCEIK